MKKLVLALFAVGSVAAAQAQSAGSILVYGNLGAHLNTVKDKHSTSTFDTTSTNKTNHVFINPGVGYAVANNMVVGIQFGADYTRYKPQSTASMERKVSDVDFHIGAFYRYTKPVGNIFFVYGQVDASFLKGNHQDNTDFKSIPDVNLKDEYTGFGINLWPAVGMNVTKCFALNFGFGGLGYETRTWTFDNSATPTTEHKTTTNDFNFTLGQQFHVGANLFFNNHPRKKGHAEPGSDTRRMDTSDDEDSSSKKKKAKSDDDE